MRDAKQDTVFDPLDDQWWRAGAHLQWWDNDLEPPRWLPDRRDAEPDLGKRLDLVIRACALTHSYRTITTRQLHDLDKRIPATPMSGFWLHMIAMGLVEPGFPINPDGLTRFSPTTAPFMAVRLPIHNPIDGILTNLGASPTDLAAIGPGPLRGRRQYDRHNLIATSMALQARSQGWDTVGEAWCRFDLITGDPTAGTGGPDLCLIGEHDLVFVELTASVNQNTPGKITRWKRMLQYERCQHAHVIWLAAGTGTNPIRKPLDGMVAGLPRMHAGDAKEWRDTGTCDDGWHPDPGIPAARPDWMRADLERIGGMLGFDPDTVAGWRLPHRLEGRWLG